MTEKKKFKVQWVSYQVSTNFFPPKKILKGTTLWV